MANNSAIEWTESTWNPTTGCDKISTGCKNCYAEKMSFRLKSMGVQKYKKEFEFVEHPDDLKLPLTWKKPRKVFVNSMSDLFHEKASFEFIGKCFDIMIKTDKHTYQILTKRSHNMMEFSDVFYDYFGYKIPSHIWMGVSVENEDNVWRIDELRKVKSETKFISFEPLVGSVGKVNLKGIDWVIIGGESGFNYRKVEKEWILEIIKQCKKQKVAVFFKQWGGIRPKSKGREINGRIYDEYPKIKFSNPLKKIEFNEIAFAEHCISHEVLKRKQVNVIQ